MRVLSQRSDPGDMVTVQSSAPHKHADNTYKVALPSSRANTLPSSKSSAAVSSPRTLRPR